MIYLDNAATTKIHPDVLKAMMPYLTTEYGNAGTKYELGRTAAKAIEVARKNVADFIGAKEGQIIFTSSGSEANNMAILGVLDYLRFSGKKRILVSSVEHDSVIKAANAAEKALCHSSENNIKDRFHVEYIRVNSDGTLDMNHLSELLSKDDVGLVSVMYVNNETGAVNPVHDIGEICASRDILFHTDCVQAAGCHHIDVNYIGCDFATISAHKIHGGKGVGALYIKDKRVIRPIIHGGRTQEFGMRGGTENVAGIVGFGKACQMAKSELVERRTAVSLVKRLFYSTLTDELNKLGISDILSINGQDISNDGKTLNIRFKNVDSETLLLMLDSRGVYVSAGSACQSHESKPSHVLLAMGLSPDEARDSVRVSFSIFNTPDEAITAAKVFAECVSTLLIL